MKITKNFGPLLLLLFLAVIPRSSSIPIATTITTVQAVVEVTKSLTEAIEWLEEKIENTYRLDETITKLETQIDQLPGEIGVIHQKVLEGLYRTQTRIVGTRSLLEEFAHHLKSQCEGLIAMYNRDDVSIEMISYSVKRFVKLASNAKVHLEYALKEYRETHDELMKLKVTLKTYNFKLEIKETEHADGHNEKIDDLERTFKIVTVFTLGLAAPIAYPIIYGKIAVLEDILNVLRINFDLVQATVANLANENDEIGNYVFKEINLIQIWQSKLDQSLSDHQPITPEDIKVGLPLIKANLTALRKACINYLNHKLPEKLQSLIN